MILAAIDFSEVSDEVARVAAELASPLGLGVLLVHVAAPDPDFVGFAAGPEVVREQRAKELRVERQALGELAERLRAAGLEARPHLVEGPTVETLVEQAARHGARFLVLGSHGKGALQRALAGSVCQALATRAPCPLVVVPARRS